jgi:putative hydrolase of the HAD superfamily
VAEQADAEPGYAVRGLILDYGEVLTHPQRRDCLQQMAVRAGTDAERFGTAYWRHRRAYDAGLAASEYWRRVLDSLGAARPADADLVDALIADDIRSWTHYREEVWELAREFRARSGRTGFLSNGVPEIVAHLRRTRALDTSFDAVVVSCEVGCMKPAPEIFRLCLERLGIAPDEGLFADDRLENVEAARHLGLRALHFVGDDAVDRLRAAIASR